MYSDIFFVDGTFYVFFLLLNLKLEGLQNSKDCSKITRKLPATPTLKLKRGVIVTASYVFYRGEGSTYVRTFISDPLYVVCWS